jgi:hypothetical protein
MIWLLKLLFYQNLIIIINLIIILIIIYFSRTQINFLKFLINLTYVGVDVKKAEAKVAFYFLLLLFFLGVVGVAVIIAVISNRKIGRNSRRVERA